MTEQSIVTKCCKELIYRDNGCQLEVSEPFQSLITVFNTPSTYIPYTFVPNTRVPRKVQTSLYSSIPNPKQGCQYLSWQQLSPPNMATFGLSWVIDKPDSVPNPLEVIQFLAPQLSYRIEWKIRRMRSVLSSSPITFVPVQSGASVAFEAPDICGKKIVLTGRKGSFIVPGQYGQFVISAPDRNVEMRLRVTGFFDTPSPYSVPTPPSTKYYVTLDCKEKVLAYTNTIIDPTTRTVQRVTSDELLTLQALAIREYHAKSFFPCFPSALQMVAPQSGRFVPLQGTQPSQARCFPSALQMVAPQTSIAAMGQTNILYLSSFYEEGSGNRFQNDLNFVSDVPPSMSCGIGVTYATIPMGGITPTTPGDTVIAQYSGFNSTQFLLQGGHTYKLTLSWTSTKQSILGASPSLLDYINIHGTLVPNANIPTYNCNPSNFTFALMNNNIIIPFIPSLSSPPPGSSPSLILFPLQFQGTLGTGIETELLFGIPNSGQPVTYTYVFQLGNAGETVALYPSINSSIFNWHDSTLTVYLGGSHDLTMNLLLDVVTA